MIRYFFIGFVFYLLYKLVFNIIVPVSRGASQIKKQMRQMQEMQQQQYQQQQASAQPASTQSAPQQQHKPSKDDYLDFEEVK